MWTLAVNDLKCPQQNWGGRKENWGGLGPPGPSLEPRLVKCRTRLEQCRVDISLPTHGRRTVRACATRPVWLKSARS